MMKRQPLTMLARVRRGNTGLARGTLCRPVRTRAVKAQATLPEEQDDEECLMSSNPEAL